MSGWQVLQTRRPDARFVEMMTVYLLKQCSTCRNAVKWLTENAIPHEVKAIRETPPSHAELQMALDAAGGKFTAIMNTSSQDYRDLGLKDRLPTMTRDEVFSLLSENGNLVKRPFLIGGGVVLCGFKQPAWQAALG